MLKKSFLAQALLAAISGVACADTFTIIDLGTLGGKQSFAFGINDNNVVVGSSSGAVDSNNVTPFANHAYFATVDNANVVTMTDVGHLGGNESVAFFADESGLVYGHSTEVSSGSGRGFVYDGVQIAKMPLPTGATQFRPLAKEASGLIVGYSNVDIDTNATDTVVDYRLRGVVLNGSTFTFLDMLTYVNDDDATVGVTKGTAVARDINVAKQVVGYSSPEDDTVHLHAARWDLATSNAAIDLGTLGGSSSQANDINDSGLSVGLSQKSGDDEVQPFVHDPSQTTPMQGLGQIRKDMVFGEAIAINNNNEIVGTSLYATGLRQRTHATYYKYTTSASATANENKLLDLNLLLSCADQEQWELSEARDINNNGYIVGQGVRKKKADGSGNLVDVGEVHAFLLKPPSGALSAPSCDTAEEKDSGGSMPIWMLPFAGMWFWRRKK